MGSGDQTQAITVLVFLPSKPSRQPLYLVLFSFHCGGQGHICNVSLLIRVSQCCSRGQRKTCELVLSCPACSHSSSPPFLSLQSGACCFARLVPEGSPCPLVCRSPPPPCTGLTIVPATSGLPGCLLRIPHLYGFAVLPAGATTHPMVGCSPLPWLHPL